MLNIIEPKDHHIYQARIDSFLGLLKVYQSFSLPLFEKEKATFIIASDNELGVYGGAVLYQQKVAELYKDIGKIVSSFQLERQSAWVARLGLYRGDEPYFALEELDMREDFYRNLLKHFIEFGEKENLDFLVLTLCSSNSNQTKHHRPWPYLLEIRSVDSSDNLFHGILSLTPQKVEGVK